MRCSPPSEPPRLSAAIVVEGIFVLLQIEIETGEGLSMKSYRVTATFPELRAAHAVHEARGEGSSLSVGIKRALDAILREHHVKGRRISIVKLFVRAERPTSRDEFSDRVTSRSFSETISR